MSIAEIIGIASLAPFMALVSNPDLIQTKQLLQTIYSKMHFQSHKDFLIFCGIGVGLLIFLGNLFSIVTIWSFMKYGHYLGQFLTKKLYSYYINREYLFHTQNNSALLSANVQEQVGRITHGMMIPILLANSRIFTVLILLIGLFFLDPYVTITTLLVFGASYYYIYLFVQKKILSHGIQITEQYRNRFKLINESFGGIKEIRVLGKEGIYENEFKVCCDKLAKSYTVAGFIGQAPYYVMITLAFGAIITLIIVLLSTTKNISQLIAILTIYAVAGYKILPAAQQTYASIIQAKGAVPPFKLLEKDLIAATSMKKFERTNDPKLKVEKFIELKNITFSYPGSPQPVLQNFNLKIQVGTTVGFVGLTGAGKTTAVDLILGLIEQDKGQLLADNTIITNENMHLWQKNLGYVPQSVYLTDDTITANIAFGQHKSEINMDKVLIAAHKANLKDFIDELPEKFNTIVGERGVQLSGGERQRIGLARVLYYDAPILILDEATSALDGITEKTIIDTITNFSRKKTIIMVAHRLTTLKNCDIIVVFNEGRIVDSGDYNDLMTRNEQFSKMANQTNDNLP